MTITPEPKDKLDAAITVVVNGPADEKLQASGSYGVAPSDLNGLLEPGAVKVARRVLRRARAQQCARAYPTDRAVARLVVNAEGASRLGNA
jgi:hypothetical protein